jgi:hypothetical protein
MNSSSISIFNSWIVIPCFSEEVAHGFQTQFSGQPGPRSVSRVAQINSFFFKSKRCHFSKKNKSQRVVTLFLTESCRVNRVVGSARRVMPGFFLPMFFLQPGLILAPSQPGLRSTHRAGFQNYKVAWAFPGLEFIKTNYPLMPVLLKKNLSKKHPSIHYHNL